MVSAVGLRKPVAYDLCSPVWALIRQMRARSTSAVMPRSVMLLLDPMPTYRYWPSALAVMALVQWWLIADGRGVTVSGGPLALVCPGW
ncbi:hypothetical protein D3C72_1445160 [compost metagenome]